MIFYPKGFEMKLLLLFLIIGHAPCIIAKEPVKKSKISLHKKGHKFEHPEILEECMPKKMCADVASNFCLSKKAHYLKCSEQYKDNWIITCECD